MARQRLELSEYVSRQLLYKKTSFKSHAEKIWKIENIQESSLKLRSVQENNKIFQDRTSLLEVKPAFCDKHEYEALRVKASI